MQDFSPIKERILQHLDNKGISKYKFYQESGITRGVLDKTSGISEDNIAKFIAYSPEVNPTWLLTGEGSMYLHEKLSMVEEQRSEYLLRTDRKIENQMIPLYSIEASAGVVPLFNDQSDQTPIDFISIPNLPNCDGAVFVTGDSMYPLLKSGDIVIYKGIKDYWENIYWGEMYIVAIDMEGDEYVSVKFVQKSEDSKDHVKLVSHNKHHQDKEVAINKIRAMALVKASIRMNIMS